MYTLEQGLVDLINAQRAEAEEFSKKPGCWMGMMPEATDLKYWEQRVSQQVLIRSTSVLSPKRVYTTLPQMRTVRAWPSTKSVWTNEELEAELEAATVLRFDATRGQCLR